MTSIILTILCSTAIAVILKINSSHKGDPLILLTGNYFTASIVSLVLFFNNSIPTASIELIPFGLLLSFLFVGSIFAFAKSVTLSGAALSTVSSRLSVFVPVILSIIFFSDLPNEHQYLGLLFTLITILLFYFSVKNSNDKIGGNKFLYLLSILLGIGIADFFMNVFQENWSLSDKPWFLFWIFFFSFLISLAITVKEKKRMNYSSLFLGLLMGVPNIFSSYFLIESLKTYSAVFVYPVVNTGIIVLTAILVKIFWNEAWNLFAKLALFSGILAIIFLTL